MTDSTHDDDDNDDDYDALSGSKIYIFLNTNNILVNLIWSYSVVQNIM